MGTAEPLPCASDDCCSAKGGTIAALGADASKRRILIVVLVINLVMFGAQMTGGILGRSSALLADSVDMLGDASVYALSLYALDRGMRWQAGAALAKGAIILAFGLWIMVDAILKASGGVTPSAATMGLFGMLALVANITCLGLLWSFRNDGINMSSTFECSRNDVIANSGVLVAAAAVWVTGSGWPDIAIALLIAGLFMRSAWRVLRGAWPQFMIARPNPMSTPGSP